MRSYHKPALLVFTLFPALAYAQSGNLSIISGVLQPEGGKRVDAIVRAMRVRSALSGPGRPVPVPGLTQYVRVSSKDRDLAFSFSGLDPGIYELCATVPAGGYLDPCLWDKSVLVNVPASQIVKGVTITLKKASTIRVHVDDPDHLIRNSPKGHLLMGVFGPHNRFIPMVRKNEDAQSKDYELAIPFDRDIKFHTRTVGITAVDGSNAPIDNGQSAALRHSTNAATPATINYRITGKK